MRRDSSARSVRTIAVTQSRAARLLPLLLIGIGAGAPAASQPAESPPAIHAVRIETAPVLDGDVLDDPAWAETEPAQQFWQTRPFAGEPASERTEVRVAF